MVDKLRIVAEAEEPRACFAHFAERDEVSRGLLWNWRAQVRRGTLRMESPASFLPMHLADTLPTARLRPLDPVQPAPPAQPTAQADQIEIELPDGSPVQRPPVRVPRQAGRPAKCLFWDTQGLVLYAKRLGRGRFVSYGLCQDFGRASSTPLEALSSR